MIKAKILKPPKQTLEALLNTNQVVLGKVVVERKRVMDEAIEHEMRERRYKANDPKWLLNSMQQEFSEERVRFRTD